MLFDVRLETRQRWVMLLAYVTCLRLLDGADHSRSRCVNLLLRDHARPPAVKNYFRSSWESEILNLLLLSLELVVGQHLGRF